MTTYLYSGDKYTAEVSAEHILIRQDGRKLVRLLPTTAVGTVTKVPEDEVVEVAHDKWEGFDDPHFVCRDDDAEKVTSFAPLADGVYRWTTRSANWEKEYILECDADGFSYSVSITGEGSVGRVDYFGGVADEASYGSDYYFCEWFYPCPGCGPEAPVRASSALANRTFYELLIPPCHVYSFRTEEVPGRFGLGLIAKEGEYNFIHYDYRKMSASGRSGFCLSVDLEGHTKVSGTFTLPKIRAFFGDDDLDIVRRYSAYHFASGLCRPHSDAPRPRWWYGPIVCGWNEQGALAKEPGETRSQQGMASQDVYMRIADTIAAHNIRPTMLIIDDKWQRSYGDCVPDPERWQDMRAFTDEMHRRGIRVLLWFRMWGGEGLPDDEKMPGEGIPYHKIRLNYGPYADPTNEKYRSHLKELIHLLLSGDEDCMNCDGFKLDYTLVMPYGKSAKSAGGQYGAELTKELYKLIYTTAKGIKPDCLINGSPCHPYFAEVCDMARVHDYAWTCRNESEEMAFRAKLFDAAMPGVLIDTDSANGGDSDDAMRYYRNQPKIGVPDIYQFTNDGVLDLTKDDWDEIERVFNEYSDRMDRLYGKDDTIIS